MPLSRAVTDTSTVPTGDSPTAAAAGTSTLAAPADHAHPRYHWTATDHALKAWTFDGAFASSGQAPSDGVLQLARVHVPIASTVTNLILYVTTAGTSLTSGQNFAALYTAAGAKVDVTADQTTPWASTGLKTMALAGGAYSAAAGDYYITFWINGSGTDPGFSRQSVLSTVNVGLAAPNFRFATADTGLTTTAPLTLAAQTAASISWWAALS